MTNEHWDLLLNTINGNSSDKAVKGFIIDSPWLPIWAGVSTENINAFCKTIDTEYN